MPNISVQLRRGTTTEHNTFTGAEGEVTVDTDLDTLRVHDGSTAGGVRLAKHSELAGAAGNTDLSNTPAASSVEIKSSTGTNTTVAGASTSLAGVMTSADKTKLNGIATGATANSSDATLLNRANHTGTQVASTISNFDTEVANNTAVAANTAKVTNATHTGDVTGDTALTIANGAVTTAKIASGAVTATQIQVNAVGQAAMQNDSIGTNELINDAVTFAKMQNINTAKVIGRTTAGSGDPEEVSILDDDTMATASNTSLATSESIKAYVDAQAGGASVYTSSETALPAANTTQTWSHSLGQAPDSIELILRCKTAEYGYSVGDEVRYTSAYTPASTYNFWATSTQIGLRGIISAGASLFHLVRRDVAGTLTQCTPANWKIVVKGIVF